MRWFVPGLLLVPALAAAAERTVAVLDDPAGDDNGAGTLVYPQRQGFEPGDLDLTSLRIVRDDKGYRFEAKFKNPVRNPASTIGDAGPESLAYSMRRGFYAFNLDVYIDQDRVKGSGNTWTLPGRRVSVDEAYAWEKAVILTPRPELMREQFIDAVAESEGAGKADDVARRIDRSVLFATDVQVRKNTVSFSVPAAFLDASAGGKPDSEWAVTAFVTGAKTSDELTFGGSGARLDRIQLGVMQPKTGRPRDAFGYKDSVVPSPVVDLLAPAPMKQAELLSTGTVSGVAWSASGQVTAPGSEMPTTEIVPGTPAASAAPASGAAPKNDIAARLRKLDDLHEQHLVTDQEYQALRRKILSEL